MKRKTETLHIKLSEARMNTVRSAAEKSDKSITATIEDLIDRYLKKPDSKITA